MGAVLQAEEEIAGINSEVADFLVDLNPANTILIAINAGQSMKRGEEIIGGQHWQQDTKCMTAVNHIIDGMPNTRTSAILSAAAEVVTWQYPIETTSPEGKRISPRTIVYPADMPPIEDELNDFLSNPSEREEGKHLAYAHISEKAAEFTSAPRFIREDSEEIQSDSVFAAAVPELLNLVVLFRASKGAGRPSGWRDPRQHHTTPTGE